MTQFANPTATSRHAVSWFEIPARDLDRATRFYERVLGQPLQRVASDDAPMAIFPYAPGRGVGGCLTGGRVVPAPALHGSLVYLNAAPSLDAALARVEASGGRIVTPKVQLPDDRGWFAHISDTEGNRVGLHALA